MRFCVALQVAKILGQNAHQIVSDLIILLRDDNLEVRSARGNFVSLCEVPLGRSTMW